MSQLIKVEKLRLENIVDMGLTFSAMMRVFEKGAKESLYKRILEISEKIFNAGSREEFIRIHREFCEWGRRNIHQAERKRKGKVITRKGSPASYGQIAKTLDVTLKVVVYYCHLPDCRKYKSICQWLNAAVDTAMMRNLKRDFPDKTKRWPNSLKDVDKHTYYRIQQLVRESIKRDYNKITSKITSDLITCSEWEDIYWEKANQ
jgi:hypothetical protein